jgi:hypothetical protein
MQIPALCVEDIHQTAFWMSSHEIVNDENIREIGGSHINCPNYHKILSSFQSIGALVGQANVQYHKTFMKNASTFCGPADEMPRRSIDSD